MGHPSSGCMWTVRPSGEAAVVRGVIGLRSMRWSSACGELLEHLPPRATIGVVTPYRAQGDEIEARLSDSHDRVHVGTAQIPGWGARCRRAVARRRRQRTPARLRLGRPTTGAGTSRHPGTLEADHRGRRRRVGGARRDRRRAAEGGQLGGRLLCRLNPLGTRRTMFSGYTRSCRRWTSARSNWASPSTGIAQTPSSVAQTAVLPVRSYSTPVRTASTPAHTCGACSTVSPCSATARYGSPPGDCSTILAGSHSS
jgi:hypothetical protein